MLKERHMIKKKEIKSYCHNSIKVKNLTQKKKKKMKNP